MLNLMIMIDKIRELVGGAKQRYVCEGYNLDLTYITPRLIAMAYPASDFLEKTYRNNIMDVSALLERNHGESYLVVNASGRDYDYSPFKGICFAMEWEDHSAPVLTGLIETCWKMQEFLINTDNSAVAVHCNHGKGRTGTLLISFLIFGMAFPTMSLAKQFYQSKRFAMEGRLRISQPCQLRYLNYMQRLVQCFPERLVSKRLIGLTFSNLNRGKYKVRIYTMRVRKLLFESMTFEGDVQATIRMGDGVRMIADTVIYLVRCGLTGEQEEARLSLHSCFLKSGSHTFRVADFSPDSLVKKSVYSKQFKAEMEIGDDCECYEEPCKLCNDARLQSQQFFWNRSRAFFLHSRKAPIEKMQQLIFGKIRI